MVKQTQIEELSTALYEAKPHDPSLTKIVNILEGRTDLGDNEESLSYCLAYVKKLVIKYAPSEGDREIMLLNMCLLEGYEGIKNLGDRRLAYMMHMGGTLTKRSKIDTLTNETKALCERLASSIIRKKGEKPLGMEITEDDNCALYHPTHPTDSRMYGRQGKMKKAADSSTQKSSDENQNESSAEKQNEPSVEKQNESSTERQIAILWEDTLPKKSKNATLNDRLSELYAQRRAFFNELRGYLAEYLATNIILQEKIGGAYNLSGGIMSMIKNECDAAEISSREEVEGADSFEAALYFFLKLYRSDCKKSPILSEKKARTHTKRMGSDALWDLCISIDHYISLTELIFTISGRPKGDKT